VERHFTASKDFYTVVILKGDYEVIRVFCRWFTVKDKSKIGGFITVWKVYTCYGETVYQYYIMQRAMVMLILFGFCWIACKQHSTQTL